MAARRFHRRAVGLDRPFASVHDALLHLGYVQIDPLNICGRMQDLILRNRVAGYAEGDLMRHLHLAPDTSAEERVAFEHHHPETHILVAFPLEAWPHLHAAMRARARRTSAWSGRLTPRERAIVPDLLAEIGARGPLSSEDFKDRRKAHRVVWGAATLVKSTLQKLFFHGRLLIAARDGVRRRYDLPERVLPAAVLARPEATPEETARWLVLLKLRQRRLATLKREELRVIADAVQEIRVENCPPLYCLNDDVAVLESCMAVGRAGTPLPAMARRGAESAPYPSDDAGARAPIQLLAPLDPLIYDRSVTAKLWHFDYTWEAYTPAAKRVRGHYALPVLAGTELIGHVEPKADRERGKLIIASRSVKRGYRVSAALDEFAEWLGLRR